MKTLIKSAALFFLAFTILSAQHKDYSSEPGYIDFGNLAEAESGDRVVEVFLESNLLRIVSKISEKEDPEVAKLIGGLKLIKANVLEVTTENEKMLHDKAKAIETQLKNKNWDMLVRVRDRHEYVNVYLKSSSDGSIVGLVVTAIDNGEASFVNIVGNIDLNTIGKLSRKFDIPALDKINNGTN
jgi:Skp family chaperone for outer membrane proteins